MRKSFLSTTLNKTERKVAFNRKIIFASGFFNINKGSGGGNIKDMTLVNLILICFCRKSFVSCYPHSVGDMNYWVGNLRRFGCLAPFYVQPIIMFDFAKPPSKVYYSLGIAMRSRMT